MAIKKEINWDLVELYVKAGASQIKIAQSLFIHPNTLADRVKEKYNMEYSTFSTALRGEGDILIEAQQYQKAMKGYWPALQWLGKVRLGQREPEMLNILAANQGQIDQSHIIMQLQHEIEELKKNADKPETE
jgi:CHASE1-domain containing sensor protein